MSKAYMWMTDIHVNFLDKKHLVDWAQYARKQALQNNVEAVLITGDISEGPELNHHLKVLSRQLGLPIYFVMGNHDYWKIERDSVQRYARILTESHDKITWMGHTEPVVLTEKTIMIGHDGWYDAMSGDWTQGTMWMRDWDLCFDFIPIRGNKASVIGLSRKFAGEAIVYMEEQLNKCLEKDFENILILTHVPPFTEAAKHNGAPNDDYAVPYYSCKMMGEMILEKAKLHPTKKFTILCGHTHDAFRYDAQDNVVCYVGGADYGAPSFQIVHIG